MQRKELVEILRDWQVLLQRINNLKERILSNGYSITACYGAKTGSSNLPARKVENYCLEHLEVEMELRSLERRTHEIRAAIAEANLSKEEQQVIKAVMIGEPLLAVARRMDMCKSYIYKVRDKAADKILLCL